MVIMAVIHHVLFISVLQSMNVPNGNDDELMADGEVMQYMYQDEVIYTPLHAVYLTSLLTLPYRQ